MANDEHVALLKQDVDAWNKWRDKNPDIRPDLNGVELHHANLRGKNLFGLRDGEYHIVTADGTEFFISNGPDLFSGANLHQADLREADLRKADLREANLFDANLRGADLREADLRGADLREANLGDADLYEADLRGADLREATLEMADLRGAALEMADLRDADLSKADLSGASFNLADLSGANLREADLERAQLVDTDLRGADLTGCRIYGASAWGLNLEGAKQQNLVVAPFEEPEITVDNIEVAQFIYLLLHNEKIRDVINTITSKAVLILGRFTDERKKVLDALREELRKHDYLPILFDFEVPTTRDVTETVSPIRNSSP